MRPQFTWCVYLLTFLLSSGASVAWATIDDHNPGLIRVLGAIDIVPTPSQLAKVTGERPERELYAVALDASLREYLRSRATSLLSMYPNSTAAVYLEELAKTVHLRSIRWMAVYTRIRAFADESALTFAQNTLTSPTTRTRHAAIRALRWVPGAAATNILTAQLDRETDRRLKKTILRMLKLRQ